MLLAGTGKTIITPRIGALLADYMEVSERIHDDLWARALVLDDGTRRLALCSVELLWLGHTMVASIQRDVAAQTGLLPEEVVIFCTHTHAGPLPHHDVWERPLATLIAEAIVEAWAARQPAAVGFGFGQLFGYNINRRWLNRPADHSVGVMRVDSADGKPLAVLTNYACHAVVMGVGNRAISGDFPGYASRQLEAALGVTALYSQGGAGDVNPLTESVRQRLAAGHPVDTIGRLTRYYGVHDTAHPDLWNIEDRIDGSFTEAETLARGLKEEVLRVWRRIACAQETRLWSRQLSIARAAPEEALLREALLPHFAAILPETMADDAPLPVTVAGIGEALLLTQPGEVFSETAVAFRQAAQTLGWRYPFLITYTNGAFAYLPPANAFAEGGYEVQWPRQLGISPSLQSRVMQAALEAAAALST
jgi:hypothetical protein